MKSRVESLQVARHRLFDLLVIGGGIAGAGVAQNAASRGLSVALIDKDDFSSGTSSRTTKLIHGGLRYLEQGRVKLTAELCQERARLEKLAPHLIRDFSFILPLSKKHTLFNWKAHIGLTLYDLVALSAQTEHHFSSLSPKAVLECAPSLSPRDLSGGLKFHDCITDDARIVLSVIKSACQEGAVAINYLQARSFLMDSGRIEGVLCHDRYSGEEFTIKASACVNATGVWTDDVCKMSDPAWTKKVTPSKGVHLIVPASAFETNSALFLPTNDNRYVFVVPWQRALMIGTTDKLYHGDIDNPLPDADEIDYLLHIVNGYSDSHRLNRSDITGTFAGLRPLVKFDSGADPSDTSSMSRDHLIFESAGGLVNVAGGKLTSYRLMAEEVVAQVVQKMSGASSNPSRTDKLMLGGWNDKQDFITQSSEIMAIGRRLSLDPAVIDHLLSSYGCEAAEVLEMIEQAPALGERICSDYPPVLAEVVFAVQNEMAVCLEDILFRRTRLGILNQKQTLEAAPKVCRLMQQLLEWDNQRVQAELEAIDANIGAHLSPILNAVSTP